MILKNYLEHNTNELVLVMEGSKDSNVNQENIYIPEILKQSQGEQRDQAMGLLTLTKQEAPQ